MWRTILVVLVVLAPAGAYAGKEDPEWTPPARFDFEPRMPVKLYPLSQDKLTEACNSWLGRASFTWRGCTRRENGVCKIFYARRGYKGATPEAIIRHEKGHCNGWGANHPD